MACVYLQKHCESNANPHRNKCMTRAAILCPSAGLEHYCTVLHCTVLYSTDCIVLYRSALNCTVLYHTVLYCTELYSAVQYRVVNRI